MAVKNPPEEMFAGNRRLFRFPVKDEDDQPLDLNGYSAEWSLCAYDGDKPKKPAALKLTSGGGAITITPATGEVLVEIPEGATVDLEGLYYSELEIFDAQSNSCVVAIGDVLIRPNV